MSGWVGLMGHVIIVGGANESRDCRLGVANMYMNKYLTSLFFLSSQVC